MDDISASQAWFFTRFFNWTYDKISGMLSRLFIGELSIPDGAVGELMRRSLANKSWFDSKCSYWVEQSFWTKLQIITGITLVAGMIGVWLGAASFLAIGAFIAALWAHKLMMLHEYNRYKSARTMAEEVIVLNQNLEDAKTEIQQTAHYIQVYNKIMKDATIVNSATPMSEQPSLLKNVDSITTNGVTGLTIHGMFKPGEPPKPKPYVKQPVAYQYRSPAHFIMYLMNGGNIPSDRCNQSQGKAP